MESVALFADVANNTFLSRVSLVIFLNKNDVFESKLAASPFARYHPTYTGENSVAAVKEHIKQQFLAQNKSKASERSVYTHVTCATDTNHIKVVWASVADVVLSTNLEKVGFSMG